MVSRQMPTPFEIATQVTHQQKQTYTANVPDGWQQGRGCFGGVVIATMLRATEHALATPTRTTRCVTAEICAPVLAEEVTIEVAALRTGHSLTNTEARMLQRGVVVARMSALLSEARSSHVAIASTSPPSAIDWHSIAPLELTGVAPVFAQHFEFRLLGEPPFCSGNIPEAEGFVRERIPASMSDAPRLVGLADVWWPALYAVCDRPRPTATVSFMAEFVVDPTKVSTEVPLRHRARVVSSSDGYFVEYRELWQGDTLVLLNQQTFALLG
jgi:hypothetical protein